MLSVVATAGCNVLAGLDDYATLGSEPSSGSGAGGMAGGGSSTGATGPGGSGVGATAGVGTNGPGGGTGVGGMGVGGSGVGGSGVGGTAMGTPAGAGGAPGPGYQRAFVTQVAFAGNLGGLEGADQLCMSAAAALGGGGWRAWLSDSSNAAVDRIQPSGPWLDLNGTQTYAHTPADFANGPNVPLVADEMGLPTSGSVWTGTLSSGQPAGERCGEWASSSGALLGVVGQLGGGGANFTDYDDQSCMSPAHLYCLEQ
jgi:Protein of unknown function (DUF1554)